MSSLQEQLLKSGLADARKAKQINKEKRKEARQAPKGERQVSEAALAAQQALAEKAEKDRELNRQKEAQAERRAIDAQIAQLITMNRVARPGASGGRDEVAYQFSHGKKIKKIYVTAKQQDQLVRGLLAIVVLNGSYELVPAPVAEKISQRDAARVLVRNEAVEAVDEDDPYADYQIPDDLMW
ncbi:DUF2058 domain-containing protein [Haliea sp. E17]|uniref:DUF2058 domain-containing protein n=1 Tax=Haliea sp. E17 TaxID=3401576 RepID=UPI003AAEB528